MGPADPSGVERHAVVGLLARFKKKTNTKSKLFRMRQHTFLNIKKN